MKRWFIGGFVFAVVISACVCFINKTFWVDSFTGVSGSSSVKSLAIHLEKVVKPDFKQVFSSIEIIPLELNDSSMVGNIYGKKLYIPGKYYVIVDDGRIVKVFDMSGKYVASSENCIGKGPSEYYIFQDVSYNYEDDTFVILDPFGNLITYTSSFDFVSKKKISLQTTDRPRNLFILNSHLCILSDSVERGVFYVYDYSADQLVKRVEYPGLIYSISSVQFPFNYVDKHLYFTPPEINDYVFEVDRESYMPISFYHLDGGKHSITTDDVKDFEFGTEEGNQYIMNESSKYSPVSRFFNTDYVVSTYIKNKELYFNFCNVNSEKNITVGLKHGCFPTFPHFFALDKDTLITILYPFELNKYMDSSLVSNKELIHLMNEEDNPCVVKYKLK